MRKGVERKFRAELAIEPGKNVAVEGCRNSSGIVISGDERCFVFDQIDAEQKGISWAQGGADAL